MKGYLKKGRGTREESPGFEVIGRNYRLCNESHGVVVAHSGQEPTLLLLDSRNTLLNPERFQDLRGRLVHGEWYVAGIAVLSDCGAVR